MAYEATRFGSSKRKVNISLQIDEDLADRVKIMKKKFKESGRYFSVSEILESALENALQQSDKTLSDSGGTSETLF